MTLTPRTFPLPTHPNSLEEVAAALMWPRVGLGLARFLKHLLGPQAGEEDLVTSILQCGKLKLFAYEPSVLCLPVKMCEKHVFRAIATAMTLDSLRPGKAPDSHGSSSDGPLSIEHSACDSGRNLLAHLPSPTRQVMGSHNLWWEITFPCPPFDPWAGTAYFGETEGPSYTVF